MDLKALIGDLPSALQYIIVIALVMLLLYVCLVLTRLLGSKYGEQQKFDDPEEYDKTVPDIFASTFLKKKLRRNDLPEDEQKK